MKTNELTGAALDWAVAKAQGNKYGSVTFDPYTKRVYETLGLMLAGYDFRPSTDWKTGGPILEREQIGLEPPFGSVIYWNALLADGTVYMGMSPLIAAMRCYVASKLGDDVDVPEELK